MSKNKTFPRPAGHHVLTPMAVVPGAAKVVDFLQRAFGGELVEKFEAPNGHLVHAEVMVGDSVIMVGDPIPETPPMPAALFFNVTDSDAVDAAYARAIEFGARSESEPDDQSWGYRTAVVSDVGGNRWTISTVIEQLTHDEVVQRMAQAAG